MSNKTTIRIDAPKSIEIGSAALMYMTRVMKNVRRVGMSKQQLSKPNHNKNVFFAGQYHCLLHMKQIGNLQLQCELHWSDISKYSGISTNNMHELL